LFDGFNRWERLSGQVENSRIQARQLSPGICSFAGPPPFKPLRQSTAILHQCNRLQYYANKNFESRIGDISADDTPPPKFFPIIAMVFLAGGENSSIARSSKWTAV
jgi:hypothetical protein